jgi:predicted RNA-binding protein with PIN domain
MGFMAELVDGNNVIGRLGGGTREGLVSELCEVARRKRKRLTVVFDGPPASGRPKVQTFGDVTVVYAAPRSADEEIVRRIREARDPRGVTVVTDDRGLLSAVAAAGARTAGVEVFSRDASSGLAAGRRLDPEKPAPPGSAAEWERWFNDPRNRST